MKNFFTKPALAMALLAYIAGIATYLLFQHNKLFTKMETVSMEMQSLDSTGSDTLSYLGSCSCDNTNRYNVDPAEDSQNLPLSTGSCQSMVNGAEAVKSGDRQLLTGPVGAWFSKVTLDIMFCHAPDANGIFVYKGTDAEGQPTFIVEAARTAKIKSIDDGTSYIYYSRTYCPTVCGVCGE